MKSNTAYISGHGDLTPKEFSDHYAPAIDDAISKGITHFVVGDFRGTDLMAQVYLSIKPVTVTVYHMFSEPRNNPVNYPTMGGFKDDESRDAAMTAASSIDIAWVRPGREKSGTAKNIKRRKERNEIRDQITRGDFDYV